MNANTKPNTRPAHVTAIALSLAALATGIGCGEESQPSPGYMGPLLPGVAGDRALTSLNPTEHEAFCTARINAAKVALGPLATVESSCRRQGVTVAALSSRFMPERTDAELQKECTDTVEKCVAQARPTSMAPVCEAPPSTCTATLAEAEACFKEAVDRTREDFRNLPECGQVTRASLASSLPSSEGGTACKVMGMKCPGYF